MAELPFDFPPSFDILCSIPGSFSAWTLAHQEHYGGVHVEVLEVEAEQADTSSERPGVCEVIINPEGQREDVGQVR